jgi:hypothetical protein
VQQLSLLIPQLLRPGPPAPPGTAQLRPAVGLQEASTQKEVGPAQATSFTQVPVELHVCGCVLDPHCVWAGPHTPAQVPPTHVWLASHAAAFCQVPAELHVCGCEIDRHCR